MKSEMLYPNEYRDFIKDNIGQVLSYSDNGLVIFVKFNNIPRNLIHLFRKIYKNEGDYYVDFHTTEIEYFSKNKEDLEIYLDSKKYNLWNI